MMAMYSLFGVGESYGGAARIVFGMKPEKDQDQLSGVFFYPWLVLAPLTPPLLHVYNFRRVFFSVLIFYILRLRCPTRGSSCMT